MAKAAARAVALRGVDPDDHEEKDDEGEEVDSTAEAN